MDIKKEVTITLNPKEVEIILKEYLLKTKAIKIESVYFHVGSHDQEGDWRAEFPEINTLDEVVCKGTEK